MDCAGLWCGNYGLGMHKDQWFTQEGVETNDGASLIKSLHEL